MAMRARSASTCMLQSVLSSNALPADAPAQTLPPVKHCSAYMTQQLCLNYVGMSCNIGAIGHLSSCQSSSTVLHAAAVVGSAGLHAGAAVRCSATRLAAWSARPRTAPPRQPPRPRMTALRQARAPVWAQRAPSAAPPPCSCPRSRSVRLARTTPSSCRIPRLPAQQGAWLPGLLLVEC